MKDKINELMDYLNISDSVREDYYEIIKEFVDEMCEYQKAICFESAELERDGYEWEDEGRVPIYKIDENSIINCKNISEQL